MIVFSLFANSSDTLLLAVLQLVFFLTLIFLSCSFLMQLFSKSKVNNRFIKKIINLLFIAPIKAIYHMFYWVIVKICTTKIEYRLQQVYLENYPITPLEFYRVIEEVFARRQIIGAEIRRITRLEWHLFSSRRIYLLIRFRQAVCVISGAPLGTSFLISWRYTKWPSKFLLIFFQVPFLGAVTKKLLAPPTFYRTDLFYAFEQAVRATVLEAADLLTQRGARPLTENEQRPLLREFYN